MCLAAPFDNASVAAFIGALAGAVGTYIVVRATDNARDRRKAKYVIPNMLDSAIEIAQQRLESLGGRTTAPSGMVQISIGNPFNVAMLNQLAADASPFLTRPQSLALSKLVFYMTQADAINEQLRLIWMQSREGHVANIQSVETYNQDQRSFLAQTEKLADAYRNNKLTEKGLPAEQ